MAKTTVPIWNKKAEHAGNHRVTRQFRALRIARGRLGAFLPGLVRAGAGRAVPPAARKPGSPRRNAARRGSCRPRRSSREARIPPARPTRCPEDRTAGLRRAKCISDTAVSCRPSTPGLSDPPRSGGIGSRRTARQDQSCEWPLGTISHRPLSPFAPRKERSVVFRSTKGRYFRGAKGDARFRANPNHSPPTTYHQTRTTVEPLRRRIRRRISSTLSVEST